MELYNIEEGHRPSYFAVIARFLFLFLVTCELVLSAPGNFYQTISDECDWFGSGLETHQRHSIGVQPVYLRCKEGSIEWQYPRGALRIVLRMGHSNKEFRGCLKVTTNSTGATLYLEGHQKLQHLYGLKSEAPIFENRQRCFTSFGGQVALFLEATGSPDSLRKDVFKFMYDLQPIKEKSYSDCRPCTEKELLYLFCTSDFVVRGFISSLYENEAMHRTELSIKSNEIIRDSEPSVFRPIEIENKSVFSGILHRPLHCGTKVGRGEFLFLGKWRLGDPVLTCAPRWAEWKRVRRKAVLSENLDCLLQ